MVGEGGRFCLDPPLRTHVGHQAASSIHLPSGRERARSHRPLPWPCSVGPSCSATMLRTAGRTQPRGDGRGQREGGFLPFSQLPPRVFALRPGSLLPGHSRATAAAVCKEPWDSPDRSRPVPGCSGQPCAPAPSCVPPPSPVLGPTEGGGSGQGHAAGVCVPPPPGPFRDGVAGPSTSLGAGARMSRCGECPPCGRQLGLKINTDRASINARRGWPRATCCSGHAAPGA